MNLRPCEFRELASNGADHMRCRHPRVHSLDGQITRETCGTCEHAKGHPGAQGGSSASDKAEWRWAVGVTTAPRASATLPRCLASLALAGWPSPQIFAEPDCDVPADYKVTRRGSKVGAWPNWYLALAELVMQDPLADCYFVVQDDVILCQSVRQFLEIDLWPPRPVGVVSLYCPSIYHSEKGVADYGPHVIAEGFGLVGALTFLFPAESARALLQDTNVVEHRLKGRRRGLCNIDAIVGRWAQETERNVYYYSPSLAGHIGEASSIWPNQKPRPSRTCQTFLGSRFDALELLR